MLECFGCERRNMTLLRIPPGQFCQAIQAGSLREKISRSRHVCRSARPPVDQAGGVSVARAQAPFIVMRQKLSLVCGHVDLHRAIVLATLAGKTQIERFTNSLISTAVFHNLTANHLV